MKKLLLFFLYLSLLGQNNDIFNYTTRNGLASNTCYILSQDSKDKIWIGSDNGLSCFDGKEFEIFNEKNGFTNLEIISSSSIGNNLIFLIDLTKKGFILNQNKIYPLKGEVDYGAQCFEVGDELFLFSNHGLQILNNRANYSMKKKSSLKYDEICNSKNDKIMYSWQSGLYLYDMKSQKSKRLENTQKFKPDDLQNMTYQNGLVYFVNEKRLDIYELNGNRLTPKIHLDSKEFNLENLRTKIDKNGNLWVMKPEGGLYYSNLHNISTTLQFKAIQKFNNHKINDVLIDHNNNIWVSSNDYGLFFIQNTRFDQLLNYPYPFMDEDINSILYFEGKTYFTASNKLFYLNNNNELTEYSISNLKDNIRMLKKIKDKLFIITNDNLYYIQNNEIHKIDNNFGALKNIDAYHDDYILLTFSGIDLYNKNFEFIKKIFNKRSYSSLQYDKDSVFAGTTYGLFKIHVATGKSKAFLSQDLGDFFISDIVKIRDDLYLCATNASGIYIFDNQRIIKHVNLNNGLSSNNVKSIHIDGNDIYAVTYNGLNRIPISDLGNTIYTFNMRDGLPSNNINDVLAKNDSIMVATDAGFFISKNVPYKNLFSAQVSIDQVSIDDKVYYSLDSLPKIYSNSTIKFKLIYPDYSSLGDIKFKYKLDGYDKAWTITTANEIIYKNIPPGSYRLEVVGINSKNEESPKILDFSLNIQHRFYQYKIVQILAFLLGLFLIIWYVYYITKRNSIRKTNNQKQLAVLELKAVKAQLNPHFISNCLNSISFLIHKGELQAANKYIDIFSKMIRLNLDYSSQNFVSIQREIRYLNYYIEMEKLRFDNHFSFEIIPPSQNCIHQNIPSFFIQPFVENAIKYAFVKNKGEGKIVVQFTCTSENEIEILIMDNGIGINEKLDFNKENSFGINLVLNRIDNFNQLHKSKIDYTYGNGFNEEMKGAYFYLKIKYDE